MSPLQCPLCHGDETPLFFQETTGRSYYRCRSCSLIFVAPESFLTAIEEKQEYDKHQNSPDDPHYRRFLNQLCQPLVERLLPHSSGLDFGSGPGPTLSLMLKEHGHTVALFDPFYAPDKDVLTKRYDFITASEVVEHLHNPARELALLWSLLKPNGWLAIMTGMAEGREAFSTWRYKDDMTHVSFFSTATMQWLQQKWKAELTLARETVFLYQKTGNHSVP